MKKNWKTKLIHSDAKVPEGFRSLTVGVQRASTVLFSDAAAVRDGWDQYESGYTYGLYGTPTTLELAAAIADYIDNFYNVERRHSYLGNISPTEFETLWTSTYSIPQLA